MVHIPAQQSELALSRRVRVEPIKISEIKMDLAQLLSGAPRRKRQELHAQLNNTKGPDREDRVRLISNAVLVAHPRQAGRRLHDVPYRYWRRQSRTDVHGRSRRGMTRAAASMPVSRS